MGCQRICPRSALRSARLPVNLIGSPISYANRLIDSPITSQSTVSTRRLIRPKPYVSSSEHPPLSSHARCTCAALTSCLQTPCAMPDPFERLRAQCGREGITSVHALGLKPYPNMRSQCGRETFTSVQAGGAAPEKCSTYLCSHCISSPDPTSVRSTAERALRASKQEVLSLAPFVKP